MEYATLDISGLSAEPEQPLDAKTTKAKATNTTFALPKAAAPNLISANGLLDAFQLLGDAQHKITALAMHSVVLTQLKKLNLIDTIPDARGEISFPTYLGRRIIVDDGCPVEDDGQGGRKYTTYLFGAGAIAQGNGSPPVPFETGREERESGGYDYVIHRHYFVLHPKGFTWKGGSNPDNSALADGNNWLRVYEQKNIPMVRLITSG